MKRWTEAELRSIQESTPGGLNRPVARSKPVKVRPEGLRPNEAPLRSFSLSLPWPPTANHGTKHAQGRHYLTADHLSYRKLVAIEVHQAGIEVIRGRYKASLSFCPPDRRRRDCDNVEKVLWDALVKAGAIADDCNMRQKLIDWRDWSPSDVPGVRIEVDEL